MAFTGTWMFRSLTDKEVEEFIEYARTHDPNLAEWNISHPVCRAEWIKRGKGPGGPEGGT